MNLYFGTGRYRQIFHLKHVNTSAHDTFVYMCECSDACSLSIDWVQGGPWTTQLHVLPTKYSGDVYVTAYTLPPLKPYGYELTDLLGLAWTP